MSDSPIKIKPVDALVMGEWVARYWNGSFVGWHMVVKPWHANRVLTRSRAPHDPVEEFETPAAVPVEVWAGQGEPPYYGPGDYKSARALQEMRKENERLKEVVAGVEALKGEHIKEVQRLHESHRVQAERATQRIATLEFELADMTAKLDRARTKEAEITSRQTALRQQVEVSELQRSLEAAQCQLRDATYTVQAAQKMLEGRNARVEALEKTNEDLRTSLHLAVKERDEAVGRLAGVRLVWGRRFYLDLSTVFLPGKSNDWGGCDVAAHNKGIIVRVPAPHDQVDAPPWLVPVFAYARQCGADFVRFTSDSPHVVPPTSVELPTYSQG